MLIVDCLEVLCKYIVSLEWLSHTHTHTHTHTDGERQRERQRCRDGERWGERDGERGERKRKSYLAENSQGYEQLWMTVADL